MTKYEPDKFIVINAKHIKNASLEKLGDLQLCIVDCFNNPEKGKDKLKNNKYYVCNQDEPYAQKVLDVILEGEREKERRLNNTKLTQSMESEKSDHDFCFCLEIDKSNYRKYGKQGTAKICAKCGMGRPEC